MPLPARVCLAATLLLLSGCAMPVSDDLGGASTLGAAALPRPTGGEPFRSLLCAGDRIEELVAKRSDDCNVRVTMESGPAAEVSLAANPLDPLNLVGGAKDFSLGEDKACGKYSVWSGYYVTKDGGRTWKTGLLPGHPGDANVTALSNYTCGSDPVLAFGPEGNVYYASLMVNISESGEPLLPILAPVSGSGAHSAIAVTRSRDGGETWDPSVILTTTGRDDNLDKEWIAVDPVTGQVYVTHFVGGALKIQRSDDQGQTWTEPVALAQSDGLSPALVQFGQVSVGADHVVHFIYFAARQGNDVTAIYHRASSDGGQTWTAPSTVAITVPPIDLGVVHKYRIVGMPSIGEDAATGHVYVAYPSRTERGDADVLFVKSTDGGRTWSAPVRVNDDLAGPANDQWQQAIAVGPDGAIHLTWMDYRDDPSGQLAYVYYSHSVDGGRTWSPNARISDAPFDGTGGYHQSGSGTIGDYMGLAATRQGVHPFWADTREGRNDIYSAIVLGSS